MSNPGPAIFDFAAKVSIRGLSVAEKPIKFGTRAFDGLYFFFLYNRSQLATTN